MTLTPSVPGVLPTSFTLVRPATAPCHVHVAVEWLVLEADRTRMRWVWEPQLRKAMTACADLRCAELWTG